MNTPFTVEHCCGSSLYLAVWMAIGGSRPVRIADGVRRAAQALRGRIENHMSHIGSCPTVRDRVHGRRETNNIINPFPALVVSDTTRISAGLWRGPRRSGARS